MFEVIPAIDVLDGKVVRLTQGSYDDVTYYENDPVELAKIFESNGATCLHMVDLNGAKDGSLINLDIFEKIRSAVSMDLELGGGIRTLESVKRLVNLGINYFILGSLLIHNQKLFSEIAFCFPNCVIAGIDLKQGKLALQGWLELSQSSLEDVCKFLEGLPIKRIICTDIERDGMMEGVGISVLSTLKKYTDFPIVASGGVSSYEDIEKLKSIDGISGCIVGKALLSGVLNYLHLWNKE